MFIELRNIALGLNAGTLLPTSIRGTVVEITRQGS